MPSAHGAVLCTTQHRWLSTYKACVSRRPQAFGLHDAASGRLWGIQVQIRKPQNSVVWNDGHWSKTVARLAAQMLCKAVEEEKRRAAAKQQFLFLFFFCSRKSYRYLGSSHPGGFSSTEPSGLFFFFLVVVAKRKGYIIFLLLLRVPKEAHASWRQGPSEVKKVTRFLGARAPSRADLGFSHEHRGANQPVF
jgi:hypothetical protein